MSSPPICSHVRSGAKAVERSASSPGPHPSRRANNRRHAGSRCPRPPPPCSRRPMPRCVASAASRATAAPGAGGGRGPSLPGAGRDRVARRGRGARGRAGRARPLVRRKRGHRHGTRVTRERDTAPCGDSPGLRRQVQSPFGAAAGGVVTGISSTACTHTSAGTTDRSSAGRLPALLGPCRLHPTGLVMMRSGSARRRKFGRPWPALAWSPRPIVRFARLAPHSSADSQRRRTPCESG